MKPFILVLVVVAWVQAKNFEPVHVTPPFLARKLPLRGVDPRITGGEEVEPHSIPYQVALLIPNDDRTSFCGGSLLSPTTVLTAAHCAEISNNITVILGAHRILDDEPSRLSVQSRQVIIHPDWNRLLLRNDIAIIRIDTVVLNDYINVVRLPSSADRGNDYLNNAATVSGWGVANDGAASISEVLRSITIPVGSNTLCNVYYLGVIVDTHLCASGDSGKSSCSGDSGGPLVASSGEQIGIVSFGISLGCEVGWPHVYTRVTEYLYWIEANSDVIIS